MVTKKDVVAQIDEIRRMLKDTDIILSYGSYNVGKLYWRFELRYANTGGIQRFEERGGLRTNEAKEYLVGLKYGLRVYFDKRK